MSESALPQSDNLGKVLPAIYADLRNVAERALANEQTGHTLQPTAVINEVFLRLAAQRKLDPQNRPQFFALAATMIRRVLVDYSKQRHRLKRGGRHERIELDDDIATVPGINLDVLALHEALERLQVHDESMSRLVELRFFAGLSVAESAEILGRSVAATQRQWVFARTWLRRELCEMKEQRSDEQKRVAE